MFIFNPDGINTPISLENNIHPPALVPGFDDHHLDGAVEAARYASSRMLTDFNSSPEHLERAIEAMTLLHQVHGLIDRQRQAGFGS